VWKLTWVGCRIGQVGTEMRTKNPILGEELHLVNLELRLAVPVKELYATLH